MTDVTEAPPRGIDRRTAFAIAETEKAEGHAAPVSPPPSPARSEGHTELLSGPVLPTLIRLALPTVVVLVAQTAVSIAEAYYVGFLGTDALAGVALVFPVFMLMTMMSNGGLGSGVSSAIARAVGAARKDDAEARHKAEIDRLRAVVAEITAENLELKKKL